MASVCVLSGAALSIYTSLSVVVWPQKVHHIISFKSWKMFFPTVDLKSVIDHKCGLWGFPFGFSFGKAIVGTAVRGCLLWCPYSYMSVGQANPWLIPSSSFFFLNLHSVLLFLSPLWSYKHSHMMLAGELLCVNKVYLAQTFQKFFLKDFLLLAWKSLTCQDVLCVVSLSVVVQHLAWCLSQLPGWVAWCSICHPLPFLSPYPVWI